MAMDSRVFAWRRRIDRGIRGKTSCADPWGPRLFFAFRFLALVDGTGEAGEVFSCERGERCGDISADKCCRTPMHSPTTRSKCSPIRRSMAPSSMLHTATRPSSLEVNMKPSAVTAMAVTVSTCPWYCITREGCWTSQRITFPCASPLSKKLLTQTMQPTALR